MRFFICISSFLIFILINLSKADYLDEYLVAYWSFDDSTAHDYSGHGYNGIIKNSPTPAPGLKGSCFHFQGKNVNIPANGNISQIGDFILLPKINFASMSEFTISLNVKGEQFSANSGGDGYIFYGDHDLGWLGIANIRATTYDSTTIKFSVGADINNIVPLSYPYNYKDTNNWINYCLVYSKGVIKAYVDGKLIGSKNEIIRITGNDAGIGCHWWTYGSYQRCARFTGYIDEVKIFNKALDSSQISNLNNELKGPVLISPQNNSIIHNVTPLFLWNKYSNASSYELQLSTKRDFSTNIVDLQYLTDTSFTIFNGALNYINKYYWRVNAINASFISPWSEIDSFVILYPPPTLLSPPDCSFPVPISNLTLDWSDVTLASNYWLQISKTRRFDSLIVNNDSVSNSNYTLPSGILDTNNTYYWRIRTFFGKFYNEWSEIRCFSAAPQLICLKPGWQLISSFVNPNNMSLFNVFNQLNYNWSLVLAKGFGEGLFFPNLNLYTLNSWNPNSAYYLYIIQPQGLSFNGSIIQPDKVGIALNKGWNYVAYLRNSPMDADSALTSISQYLLICENGSYEKYCPTLNIKTLEQGTQNAGKLIPGKGYMIYVTNSCTLTYPGN
jgi:hypothetical protein